MIGEPADGNWTVVQSSPTHILWDFFDVIIPPKCRRIYQILKQIMMGFHCFYSRGKVISQEDPLL